MLLKSVEQSRKSALISEAKRNFAVLLSELSGLPIALALVGCVHASSLGWYKKSFHTVLNRNTGIFRVRWLDKQVVSVVDQQDGQYLYPSIVENSCRNIYETYKRYSNFKDQPQENTPGNIFCIYHGTSMSAKSSVWLSGAILAFRWARA